MLSVLFQVSDCLWNSRDVAGEVWVHFPEDAEARRGEGSAGPPQVCTQFRRECATRS